jgi:hypothetical protein
VRNQSQKSTYFSTCSAAILLSSEGYQANKWHTMIDQWIHNLTTVSIWGNPGLSIRIWPTMILSPSQAVIHHGIVQIHAS